MTIADYIEYIPSKVLDQGSDPLCTSYALCVTLSEMIQNNNDLEVDFDPQQIFEQRNNYIKNFKGNKADIKNAYLDCGRREGFLTSDGKYRIWITGGRNISTGSNSLAKNLQQFGPVIFGINLYEGHSITTDPIKPVPSGSKIKGGHSMLLRAHELKTKRFKFQNSWGDKSVRWIDYDVIQQLIVHAYVIYHYDIQLIP